MSVDLDDQSEEHSQWTKDQTHEGGRRLSAGQSKKIRHF